MESFRKIKINDSIFDCVDMSQNIKPGEPFFIVVNANYFQEIRNISKIDVIDVFDDQETLVLSTRDYGEYENIIYQRKENFPQYVDPTTEESIDTCLVIFKLTSLVDIVNKLNAKVNSVIDTESMDINEYRDYKIKELGKACNVAISSGADVETEYGIEHFSYTLEDQSNLKDIFISSSTTKLAAPYHADDSGCKVYSANDILKIYLTLSGMKLYHTTYCNALNEYARDQLSKETLAEMNYGMDVPAKYKEDMDAAIAQGQIMLDAILAANSTSTPGDEINENTKPKTPTA